MELFVDFEAKSERKLFKSCSQWAVHCKITKNPQAGKIGEEESDVHLLK
jgi:uncharacterized protein YggU (UPF0235/DUF167 family)